MNCEEMAFPMALNLKASNPQAPTAKSCVAFLNYMYLHEHARATLTHSRTCTSHACACACLRRALHINTRCNSREPEPRLETATRERHDANTQGTLCNHTTCCNMFYVLALHILLISRSMTWNHDYGACMIMAYNNLCAVALISPTQTNRGEDRNRRKHKQTDMTISYCCCLALAMNIKRHDDDEHANMFACIAECDSFSRSLVGTQDKALRCHLNQDLNQIGGRYTRTALVYVALDDEELYRIRRQHKDS